VIYNPGLRVFISNECSAPSMFKKDKLLSDAGWSSPDMLCDLLYDLRTPLWLFGRQVLQEGGHGLWGLHLDLGYPGWIIHAGKSNLAGSCWNHFSFWTSSIPINNIINRCHCQWRCFTR